MKTSWLRCLHPLVNLVFLLRLTRCLRGTTWRWRRFVLPRGFEIFDECPEKNTPRTSLKQGPVIQNYDYNMTYKHIWSFKEPILRLSIATVPKKESEEYISLYIIVNHLFDMLFIHLYMCIYIVCILCIPPFNITKPPCEGRCRIDVFILHFLLDASIHMPSQV